MIIQGSLLKGRDRQLMYDNSLWREISPCAVTDVLLFVTEAEPPSVRHHLQRAIRAGQERLCGGPVHCGGDTPVGGSVPQQAALRVLGPLQQPPQETRWRHDLVSAF